MKTPWTRAVLLSLASVCSLQATAIDYTINFTNNSGPIATGSFTYDAAVPAFSNFIVFWDGLKFDLTTSANAPFDDGPGGPACLGGKTGAAAGFAWLSPGCQTFPVGWTADATPSGNSVIASFNFPEQNSSLQIGIHQDGSAADDDDTGDRGTFTISPNAGTAPTPEPGTLGVFVSGFGLLMVRRMRAKKAEVAPARV
jgi:hypothetical protein